MLEQDAHSEVNPVASQLEVTAEQPEAIAPRRLNPRTWQIWVARIAMSILSPLLLFGLVEAGLRVFGVGYPTGVTVPCTVQGRPAACYNLFFAAPFFPPGMIKTPQMYAIPAVKAPHTFRIFVLGESAAMGDPEPAYGFSRYLEVMLREQFPSENFEVINTGIVAINSHVLVRIAKGLAAYQPDLFVIYAGNNEVVGPYGPGTVLTTSAMSLPVIRSSIFLRSSRIGQLVGRVAQPKQQWRGMEMFLDKQVRADSPLLGKVYENFAANLRDMIAVARNGGAHVIVSTVATNLKDCAPFASLHREDLGQDGLRSWSALVEQGAEFENAGRYPEALKRYESAAQIDDGYAELQFRIARSLWAIGEFSAARDHFIRARDLDTLRFRSDSKINDIIRSVQASSNSGVALVDSEAILASESPHGLIGSRLLYEHVHLTPAGNYLLARALLPAVVSHLPLEVQPSASANLPSEAECERLLALTNYDGARMENEMIQRVLRPPFTNRVNNSSQVQEMLARLSTTNEAPSDTAEQYQWAIARWPDDRLLHFNYGLFLYPYNPAAAEQQFAAARPFDGFPLVTPDGAVH
jgi:tetratricopeptide (TPR) repeat protein